MPDLGNIYELHSFLELNNITHAGTILKESPRKRSGRYQTVKSLPYWSIERVASWNDHLFEVCSRRVWWVQTDYSNWRHCNQDHLLVPTQYLVVLQPHWLFKGSLHSKLNQIWYPRSWPKKTGLGSDTDISEDGHAITSDSSLELFM